MERTMVCDFYEMKVGDVLIESLKEEITDGDFCGLLTSKFDDNKNENKSKAGEKALTPISIAGGLDNPLVEVEYKGRQSNVILTTQGESTLKIFGE